MRKYEIKTLNLCYVISCYIHMLMEFNVKILNQKYCVALDDKDELQHLKNEFVLPNSIIYLGGNTLGARPHSSSALTQQFIAHEWDEKLAHHLSNEDYHTELPRDLGNKIAGLIGANNDEVMVADSTALNLFKTLAAAIKIQAKKHPEARLIVAERDALPTDIHIIQSFIELHQQLYQLEFIEHEDELEQLLATGQVAVVVLSQIHHCTGRLKDLMTINRLIHQHFALVIWDLCQSVGVFPTQLNQSQADFAVGCTYKYLNGGPGAPAFLWVNEKHLTTFWDPLNAWNNHNNPLDIIDFYEPFTGLKRYMSAHQPIISMRLIECGLNIFAKTNLEAIRLKSLKLTDLFIELMEQECADFNFKLITPQEHQHRGGHLSYNHPFAYEICQALCARGVITDYREADIIRFAFAPLYIRYIDVWNTVQQIKSVMQNVEWQIKPYLLTHNINYD